MVIKKLCRNYVQWWESKYLSLVPSILEVRRDQHWNWVSISKLRGTGKGKGLYPVPFN